jgi:hypothetical protein
VDPPQGADGQRLAVDAPTGPQVFVELIDPGCGEIADQEIAEFGFDVPFDDGAEIAYGGRGPACPGPSGPKIEELSDGRMGSHRRGDVGVRD